MQLNAGLCVCVCVSVVSENHYQSAGISTWKANKQQKGGKISGKHHFTALSLKRLSDFYRRF